MDKTILHLEDVYKRYINQKKKEFTVLNDIDLKVNAGEFVSVVGPSGCGKSTLLRLILGSEPPSDGIVRFNGEKIITPDRDRGIVFQKYSLFPHLSILDNIAFGLDAENLTRENLKNLLLKSDAVGMSVYINNYTIAADVAREIKQIYPSIPLIIGGPHCTFLKGSVFSQIPSADISVESEGEFVILDLVRYFEGNKKLSDIHGINYKENNQIKSSKPLEVIDDLNSLPFPARHLTEKYEYSPFYGGLRPKKKFTTSGYFDN